MAAEKKDEKKKSKTERRYGDAPKIKAKEEKSEAPVEETEHAPEPPRDENTPATPDSGPMEGTDGIPVQHSSERAELHQRHQSELSQLHHRHEREHAARVAGHHPEAHDVMQERHHAERRTMHTGQERELREMHKRHLGTPENKGKGGTEK